MIGNRCLPATVYLKKLRIEEHPFVLFDTQLFVFTTDGYSGSGFDAGVS